MKQNTDFLNPYKLTLLRELDQKCKQGDLEANAKDPFMLRLCRPSGGRQQ